MDTSLAEKISLLYEEWGNGAKSYYPIIYREVFDQEPTSVPDFLIIAYRGKQYVGFLSCRRNGIHTVYISHAGFVKEHRNGLSPKIFKYIVNDLHKRFPFILGRIHNENIPAIKVALYCGFKIIGVRQATDGSLFLEVLRSADIGDTVIP